jgi:glycerol-3-phosphate dehydrogenase
MPPAALRSGERESRIARLEAERFDLVVIGGGITGAGIACEGARRGLRVALLEAGDFATGTSSRSSKFVHGGLRYLALGDVATVRSTALERKVLHRIAPHLAEPHWVVVPSRSWAGLAKLRAALTAYEKLGEVEDADRHRNWSGEELARGEPILDRSVYPYACVFREYLTDDARLVLANLRAAAGYGAAVLSRAPVGAILREGSAACGVEATCAESGGSDRSGARFSVRARCVVNAAGPWVDAVRVLEDPDAAPKLHLSKGVHVVFRRERLPLRNILLLGTAWARPTPPGTRDHGLAAHRSRRRQLPACPARPPAGAGRPRRRGRLRGHDRHHLVRGTHGLAAHRSRRRQLPACRASPLRRSRAWRRPRSARLAWCPS